MKSTSNNSCRDEIRNILHQCRTGTLKLFEGMDDATFRRQSHPDFSPAGWHLGHIAYTEALWLLQRGAGFPPLFPEYHRLFAADGLPKKERVRLPALPEIIEYLKTIREKVLHYLDIAPVDEQERLWRFIIQHESQHGEIISFVLRMLGEKYSGSCLVDSSKSLFLNDSFLKLTGEFSVETEKKQRTKDKGKMIEISAGEFEQGNDFIDALDNERSRHRVYLPTYSIDRYPVTCGEYREFMEAGGYQNPSWWSTPGWKWLQIHKVEKPLYWLEDPSFDRHPVCGVSWYEADAYTRFVGKRLPTEAEWEKAASWDAARGKQEIYPWGEEEPTRDRCNHNYFQGQTTPVDAYPAGASACGCYDMLGNVWEWTSSWFDAYPGFEYYPYPGYSQVYFDREHRVLRGGSWATRPWALRSSFRNWYNPGVRQIFAGFRACQD